MKTFIFDTLVDAENICNLENERKIILKAIAGKKKLVIYGPRNFGKTSLVKNVVIPSFRNLTKKNFVFFADLMSVKDWNAIEQRIERSFSISFAEAFPAKQLVETAKRFLANLKPQFTLDSQTGSPSLSLTSDSHRRSPHLDDIFRAIASIAKEIPTLIIADEFQDIAFVDEAEAKFRAAFQELGGVPILLMGSKRHILANIFAKPEAPLASFGQDLEFHPIHYEEYYHYIVERFAPMRLKIDIATATILQDALNRIPESINMVCAHFIEHLKDSTITPQLIFDVIARVVESRQSRFEQFLSSFNSKEEDILKSVAKNGPIKRYNGTEFLKTVSVSSRMVGIIFNKLWNASIFEKNHDGYRIADPLLREYLKTFR